MRRFVVDVDLTLPPWGDPAAGDPQSAAAAALAQVQALAYKLGKEGGLVLGDTHDRVRTDRIDASGTVLRHGGRRPTHRSRTNPRPKPRPAPVADLNIRIIDAATGELLRDLVLDPSKDYQGTGRPPGPAPRKRN